MTGETSNMKEGDQAHKHTKKEPEGNQHQAGNNFFNAFTIQS